MHREKADQLFNAALEAGRKRDYERAIAQLEEILCRTDEYPLAILYLARSYHSLKEYGRAIQYFRYYLHRQPESAPGYFFLGRTYLSAGLPVEAIPYFKKAVKLNPGSAETLGLLGFALLKAGRPRSAIEYFAKALEIEPEQPHIFTGYLNSLLTHAINLFYHERMEEAEEIFQFIIKNRPGSLTTHLYLASIYRELGKTDLSLLHYQHASNLSPGDPTLFLQRAFLLLKAGKNEQAFAELKEATSLLGTDSSKITDPEQLLRIITLTLFRNGKFRRAIYYGSKVLKNNYQDADMHVMIAESFRDIGEPLKARNHYERALAVKPDHLDYYYGFAALLWEENDFQEMAKILKRIFKLNENDWVARYYLALTLPHLGESKDRTITLLQESIKDFGPDPVLMNALGLEYLQAELPELAENWFTRTLKVVEDNGQALKNLITVYTLLNKTAAAKKTFFQYLKHYSADQDVRRQFVQLLYHDQDYKALAEEILILLPLKPRDKNLKRMLAISYSKTARYSEAIVLYRSLLVDEPGSLYFIRALVYCMQHAGQQ
ncbi:MAG: tetratricopeptide repeat protein, partial [Spirochaeta sp.]|nr:tetratricopeptide repeat protein [Spirochaeta sp.]